MSFWKYFERRFYFLVGSFRPTKVDKFTDRLFSADCLDVKVIEDFSDMDASTVSDDIVENTEDTMTLLHKYVDELSVDLDKDRLKNMLKSLYTEAQDLEL